MDEVVARDSLVWHTVPDAYGVDATNAWTPAYARELGEALIAAAQAAEKLDEIGGPEFALSDLVRWLGAAQIRWGDDITARRSGSTLAIFQDGRYRAGIDLDDERPTLGGFADDDA